MTVARLRFRAARRCSLQPRLLPARAAPHRIAAPALRLPSALPVSVRWAWAAGSPNFEALPVAGAAAGRRGGPGRAEPRRTGLPAGPRGARRQTRPRLPGQEAARAPPFRPAPPRRDPSDWRAACVHTRGAANGAPKAPDLARGGGQWEQRLARRRQACAGEKDPGRARRGGGARRRWGRAGRGAAAAAAELEVRRSARAATRRGLRPAPAGLPLRGLLASDGRAAPARLGGVVGVRSGAEPRPVSDRRV